MCLAICSDSLNERVHQDAYSSGSISEIFAPECWGAPAAHLDMSNGISDEIRSVNQKFGTDALEMRDKHCVETVLGAAKAKELVPRALAKIVSPIDLLDCSVVTECYPVWSYTDNWAVGLFRL